MKRRLVAAGVLSACALWLMAGRAQAAGASEYVIHISVDGLGASYLQALLDKDELPTFKRMQREGAWTHNARTDYDFTITLPNHTCMVTGRPVRDKMAKPNAILGHQWTINSDPGERTLHYNRHAYVPSSFDVAHDHGLRTCMFASKSKFVLYDISYNERNGAPDATGEDNGRDKLDLHVYERDSGKMVERFIEEMKAKPFNYSFLHFHETDSAGHSKKWGSPEYNEALKQIDGWIGKVLDFVSTDERLKGKTTVILSTDHGGIGLDHGFNTNPINYTIPFYVWGAGVTHTDDLYNLNSTSRHNPGQGRPDYTDEAKPPIRNGDGANLALKLLGLPAIPESTINAAQDLNVQ